ncbi:N-formylglutamate deformylase [Lysobacter pythonis]|uniref:N-formylglutamate deformylase n=1 Tax=Solilutibacter pythonis TaxID=2483112 RepID=A0A3M2HLY5_9GAMM|nr:N-formylglutamate deformylase [Lysobacter pythonis]RMH88379.1 N-formylglutamate deformylase [Lysobacter pythonis]
MDTPTHTLHRGTLPLLISAPHDGSRVPAGIAARLTPAARRVPDTDWHIARLYRFAREMGASIIVPKHSRYVIDLNRGEDDVSLYPGQNTTGLCPLLRFSGEPVYLPGREPDEDEVRARVETFWRPYHHALRGELERLHAEHGRVLLWEAHSIRGELPFLFEGRLPDLNLGTASGNSCLPETQARIETVLAGQGDYGFISNGRFKGGHITRHYGRPDGGIEAVQLEISQRCYMDEDSFEWNEAKAECLRPLLKRLIQAALA